MYEKSVIGSPLKLNKIADLTSLSPTETFPQKEYACTGLDISLQIPLQHARKILQKFIKREQGSGLDESMLALLCSAADTKKTLMIGAHKEVANDHKMLTTFLLTLKEISLPSLEESQQVKSKHYQMTAEYELLDPSLGLGSISLDAKWSDVRGRLKITKPLSTEFFLKWNTTTGNEHSPVYALNKEMQRVSLLMDALSSEALPEENFFNASSQSNALEMLQDLLAGKKMVPTDQFPCVSVNRLKLSPAANRDFTDELWDVLTCCSDAQEMMTCMRETFDEMREKQARVFVSGDNHSMLANLIRMAVSGLAVFPPLNVELTLRLATEIGVEKLRKFFYHVLVVANKLCSPDQWDKLLNQGLPTMKQKSELANLSAQFAALRKFHRCLESVSIIDAFTDNQDLPKIATFILNSMKRGEYDSSECGQDSVTYTMPVSPAQALPELEKHQWASLRRESNASGVVTIETFLHHMPDGFMGKIPCESGSALCFTAQHNTLQL
ncbi:protein zwilch homolog [Plakobranchus ocellatus]|uniref:Protein zwilch n=1 Tax=Plakobranchus ocellatus TaxID=259542 RepID=A0AAV3ZKM7_9GAST|nr:protein zwilch homolog [Plakobranchus ocellatus]